MDELDCAPINLDDDSVCSLSLSSQNEEEEAATTTSTASNSSSSVPNDILASSFPFMELPVEVRSKVVNCLSQPQANSLRKVCRQLKDEVDLFYEFTVKIFDTTNLLIVKERRCKEVVVWKFPNRSSPGTPLLSYPSYLKVLKVSGPITQECMKNLISDAVNLEQLTLNRRAPYPSYLNLHDCPALSNLIELRYLRLNTEERIQSRLTLPPQKLSVPPLMDCYFPKLTQFEILKRFAVWQYSHYVTCILKFIAVHATTLHYMELDLLPLSCTVLAGESGEDSNSDTDSEEEEQKQRQMCISTSQIQLEKLCKIELRKFCVTTTGGDSDIGIWATILKNQALLKELRFDWLCGDSRGDDVIKARQGFPWIHFRLPILLSQKTLVHVELSSLSMFTNGSSSSILPLDLSIFRECVQLRSLILRCRENHAVSSSSPSEVLLCVNSSELPASLDKLEIYRFPMHTSDLKAMMPRLAQLRKLMIHECGKTESYGVNTEVLIEIAKLEALKFLDVIGFNDGGRTEELECLFRSIGLPYEGSETWLELSDAQTSAHEVLKVLL